MGFEAYTQARDSALRNADQMRERNALQGAGDALNAGDSRGAINALNSAGMIGEAQAIQTRNVSEKADQREAQMGAIVSAVTGLMHVPQEQRAQVLQTRIAPVFEQVGLGGYLSQIGPDDLSDASLQAIMASMGGEVEQPTTYNTSGGVVERDPYSGAYSMGYEVERAPSVPAGYRQTADGNLEAIPGGPADPRTAGAIAASRRAPPRARSGGGGGGSPRATAPRAPGGASSLPVGFTVRGR